MSGPPDDIQALFEEDMRAAQRAVEGIRLLPSEHPDMIVSNERAEEIVKSGEAVRMVMRFHGERHDLSQRIRPEIAKGRGNCDTCGHPIYFDNRPHMQRFFPAEKMCVTCAIRIGTQGGKVAPPEIIKLTECPTYCRWAQEHHDDPSP